MMTGENSAEATPEPHALDYLIGGAGAVLFGAVLPSVLVALRLLHFFFIPPGGSTDATPLKLAVRFFSEVLLYCLPGAIVLSVVLLKLLSMIFVTMPRREAILTSLIGGALIAFMNIPARVLAQYLTDDTFVEWRIASLFAVVGATLGAWVGWLAWRRTHAIARLVPQVSLRSLFLAMVLWGAVLAVFHPRELTQVFR